MSTSGADIPAGAPARPRLPAAELLAAEHTRPIQSPGDLAADIFEPDEELEGFPAFTYAGHHRDLACPRYVTSHPGTDVASLLHQRKLTGPLATHLIGREPQRMPDSAESSVCHAMHDNAGHRMDLHSFLIVRRILQQEPRSEAQPEELSVRPDRLVGAASVL